jgi:hypothetical protein
MTMTPVFGEFLGQASDHISAAVSIPGPLPDDVRGGVIRELDHLVTTLTGYLSDMLPPAEFAPATAAQSLNPDMRAVLSTRIALRRAAQSLHSSIAAVRVDSTHPAIWHMSSAAAHLAAGRDLLQTHFASRPSGVRDDTSSWAAALTSRPVTTALLARIGGIAAELAPWAARVSMEASTDPSVPAAARLALHAASRWLWKAGATAAAFARQQPPASEAHLVLAAIPANIPPPRRPVTGPESLPDLCAGVMTTAERLGHAATVFARQARWSPQATSATWRSDALASAITGHSSELVLRTLTHRAADLGAGPAIEAHLRTAASTMNDAWTAWRTLTGDWDVISTNADGARGVSPVAAESPDLALRIGRLAYQDPGWTPACGSASHTRDPAVLAPAIDDVRNVVAAVHYATHAITQLATQDRRAVRTAAADRRLYLPTRLIPARNTSPHPYTAAPRMRVDALLTHYDHAVSACASATAAIDTVALAIEAPSRVHTISRRLAASDQDHQSHAPGQRYASQQAAAAWPSRIEQALLNHETSGPDLLYRAAIGEAPRASPPKR